MGGVYLDHKRKGNSPDESSAELCNLTWAQKHHKRRRFNMDSGDPNDLNEFYESDEPQSLGLSNGFQLSEVEFKRLSKKQETGRLKRQQGLWRSRSQNEEEGELAYGDEEKENAKIHKYLHQRWDDYQPGFKECLHRTKRRVVKGAQYIWPMNRQVVIGMIIEHRAEEREYLDGNNEDLVRSLFIVHCSDRAN